MVPIRQIIDEEWRRSAELRPYVHLDAFVTMPDHFHALITLDAGGASLGHVIGAFKAAVTRRYRGTSPAARIWHRNYYERIIRGTEDLEHVRHYIRMNPWRNIIHFGKGMRGIGNPGLWHLSKIGMLCSRNCPQDVLTEAERRSRRATSEHCVISGFHSPPEKAIMAALLESGAQLICCPAWGIDTIKLPKEWLPALEANRMLIVEMSNGDANLAAARERNEFVMQVADQVWVPYVSPGGMMGRR